MTQRNRALPADGTTEDRFPQRRLLVNEMISSRLRTGDDSPMDVVLSQCRALAQSSGDRAPLAEVAALP